MKGWWGASSGVLSHGCALIVDEDREMGARLAAVLATLGFRSRLAATAEEAFRFAEVCMPDLLLTSVMLSDGSGLELASHLRQHCADLAVVYMSRRNDLVQVGGPLHRNSTFLRTPFDPDELADRLRELAASQMRMAAHASR
jgi:DNA-binding response OmpR family regulator